MLGILLLNLIVGIGFDHRGGANLILFALCQKLLINTLTLMILPVTNPLRRVGHPLPKPHCRIQTLINLEGPASSSLCSVL